MAVNNLQAHKVPKLNDNFKHDKKDTTQLNDNINTKKDSAKARSNYLYL